MVDGLITDYIAQMDWAYNRDVVHPEAARRRGWLRELGFVHAGPNGRRRWASLLGLLGRSGDETSRASHAPVACAEGPWATGAEGGAR